MGTSRLSEKFESLSTNSRSCLAIRGCLNESISSETRVFVFRVDSPTVRLRKLTRMAGVVKSGHQSGEVVCSER